MKKKKPQDKSPEQELNKMNTSNFSETECKIMAVKIVNSMRKDIETMKNNE